MSHGHPTLSYISVIRSPYLSSKVRLLPTRLLSPQELKEEFEELLYFAHDHPYAKVTQETLGYSESGRELIGWRVSSCDLSCDSSQREKELPIILSASQHHGPENTGASASLYFSYLLLADPRFQALLTEQQFVFFPQQNPDALDLRGNLDWMRVVCGLNHSYSSIEAFAQSHQYDPRSVDVEHGVPAQVFNRRLQKDSEGNSDESQPLYREEFKRSETQSLIHWIDTALAQGEKFKAYFSGHAWDILNGPLFLISGALESYSQQHTWIKNISAWSSLAPYRLNTTPPLSSDYVLHPPECLKDRNSAIDASYNGIYQTPRLTDFQSLNHESAVQYSTLAYFESRVPDALVVVLEPPIMHSPLFDSHLENTLLIDEEQTPEEIMMTLQAELLEGCAQHDALIKLITSQDEWQIQWNTQTLSRESLEDQLIREGATGISMLEARVILEVQEQSAIYHVWQSFFEQVNQGTISLKLSKIQLIVAKIGQRFTTANLAAQVLKLINSDAPHQRRFEGISPSDIQEIYQSALRDLKNAQLHHFDPRASCFVYLSALLGAAGLSPKC